jgi:hypothetical protein
MIEKAARTAGTSRGVHNGSTESSEEPAILWISRISNPAYLVVVLKQYYAEHFQNVIRYDV